MEQKKLGKFQHPHFQFANALIFTLTKFPFGLLNSSENIYKSIFIYIAMAGNH